MALRGPSGPCFRRVLRARSRTVAGGSPTAARRALTACVLQPDQAVEEVIEAQLELLVRVPEDDQLQEVTGQLKA